ncbi:short chain dehydrogenase/reductase family [Aspergillus alliaceus]|uniref:Short chain dehydrogenase/reductase family n=2 Tax=Petromyces alliaceus TaxID=209559 RepID=A0A5N7CDN3_PETAA|nr:short chain dehydrogenase/reductase family [Aspergillus alliaceus]
MSHLQPSTLFSVKGLVVVLTGGGSGLGRMMAHTLDANNASKIFIIGRRIKALQETIAQTPNANTAIIPIQADISSKESLEAAYKAIAAQTDHVDLLLANSGILGPNASPPPPNTDGSLPTLTQVRDRLWSVPMEDFTKVLDVNVTGAYYTVLAFLPLLEAANKQRPVAVKNQVSAPTAQVIITTSIAGFNRKVPVSAAYNLSKAAANHLVKMLSTTLAFYDIRVNGIAPGIYLSEMSAQNFEEGDKGVSDGTFRREMIPLTRAGGEEDIAGLLLYMASAAGGYLNGNITISDGGRLGNVQATY